MSDTKKVRLVSNGSYAYKGQLFKAKGKAGETLDYTLSDAQAVSLLEVEDSPFREVDSDGNIIPNEADRQAALTSKADLNARTVNVPKRPEVQVPGTGSKDADEGAESKKATKTLVVGGKKSKEVPEAPKEPAEGTKDDKGAEDGKGEGDKGAGTDPTTDGAVEV